MSAVENLIDRLVEGFRKNGVEPYYINGVHPNHKIGDMPPKRTVDIEQTFRQNHSSLENVTATISVTEWTESSVYGLATGKRLFKVKCDSKASDKVIHNRVMKTLEAYNSGL